MFESRDSDVPNVWAYRHRCPWCVRCACPEYVRVGCPERVQIGCPKWERFPNMGQAAYTQCVRWGCPECDRFPNGWDLDVLIALDVHFARISDTSKNWRQNSQQREEEREKPQQRSWPQKGPQTPLQSAQPQPRPRGGGWSWRTWVWWCTWAQPQVLIHACVDMCARAHTRTHTCRQEQTHTHGCVCVSRDVGMYRYLRVYST